MDTVGNDEAQFERAVKVVEARCKQVGEEMVAAIDAAAAEAGALLQPVTRLVSGPSMIFSDMFGPVDKLEFFVARLKRARCRANSLQASSLKFVLYDDVPSPTRLTDEDVLDLDQVMSILTMSTTAAKDKAEPADGLGE